MRRTEKLSGIIIGKKKKKKILAEFGICSAGSRVRSLQPCSEGWHSGRMSRDTGMDPPTAFQPIINFSSYFLEGTAAPGAVSPLPRSQLTLPTVARRVPIVQNERFPH